MSAENLSVDGKVIVNTHQKGCFHVFWDCPAAERIQNPRVKERAVLFDSLELCSRCKLFLATGKWGFPD